MNYTEKVIAWRNLSPIAEVQIGRFTLTYEYRFDHDIGGGEGWMCRKEPEGFDGSPEATYYDNLLNSKAAKHNNWKDLTYIDVTLKLIADKPFQGEAS